MRKKPILSLILLFSLLMIILGYMIALDERGHGNSGGSINRLHVEDNEYKDVICCAEYLEEEQGCEKICLVGHSLGALEVTKASIWSTENDEIGIFGTIAISATSTSSANSKNDKSPEDLMILSQIFSRTFNFEMRFANIADEMDEDGAPFNYLVIFSENDGLINIDKANELCDLAGGPGRDSKADFNAGNASDLYVIDKEDNAIH
ncbi:MAG: serine aminopeptidase domain-containing protein [Promethearchaeota archaeon]